MKAWWRLRAWWHAQLFHPTEVMPAPDGALLIECSCGGHGQVKRNDDGTATVTEATCPLWRWRFLCRPVIELPKARALP